MKKLHKHIRNFALYIEYFCFVYRIFLLTFKYNKDTMNMKTKLFTGRIEDNVSDQPETVFIETLRYRRVFCVEMLHK